MADSPTPSSLDADDPRISEWLDGRLAPADAVEIERAVTASPELTLLVEDLRAIRGVMRATAGETVEVDLGHRIMAAIAASHGSEPRVASASRTSSPPSDGGRRLPWLGLFSALAAGLLVTVVINLPKDDGREVALAPVVKKKHEAFGRAEGRRELTEETGDRGAVIAKEGEGRLEVAQDEAAGRVGEELLVQERFRDTELKGQVPNEAAPVDALAANAPPSFENSLRRRADTPNAESVSMYASGAGGGLPQGSAAPSSPPPPSAVVPLPAAEPSPLVVSDDRSQVKQDTAVAATREAAKRVKVDLAGVLVISVTSPSERRALDRLVADSGLQATPEKDHLELVGKSADIDAFLEELTRVGLVSAVPSRRTAQAGKLRATEKSEGPNTTLILRVVERKAKGRQPVEAGEAQAKP